MKKKYLILLVLLLIGGISNAQFSYDKQIENNKFSKVHKKIKKRYKKNPNEVSVNYDFSILYSIKNYKIFNIDTAYKFSKRTETLYSNSPDKEKLKKKLFTEETITKLILSICKIAFDKSVEENTIESYNYFLNNYLEDNQLRIEATKMRNNIAFDYANSINSIKSFQDFINTYPNAEEIPLAIQKRNTLAFSKAEEKNTIEGYQSFIDTYPKANEVEKAKDLRDQLAFEKANTLKTSTAFIDFLSKYPNSKLYSKAVYEKDKYIYFENNINDNVLKHIEFLNDNPYNKYKEAITDSLFYISKRQENLQGLQYLIENYDYSNLSDSIWYYYYKVFTNDGYPSTYETFKGLYESVFPFLNILNKEYETSLLIDDLKIDEGYQKQLYEKYKEYIGQASDKYFAFQVLQIILKPYLDKKNWEGALNNIANYQSYFGSSNKYVIDLIELLKFSDRNIKAKNIERNINTESGGEYVPVISADNYKLYFCGKDRKDNLSGEDIFVSEKINGYWQKPKIISDLCTYGNDAPLSVSTDGNRILTFKNGDLYYSDQTYYGWSEIEALPFPINSDEWDADAMISSDGKAIIFSSQRKDANKGTGIDLLPFENTDIYVCIKNDNGWSEPLNLGPQINTRFTDRTPYLHSDMKTLYFSSNGHGGLGDLDVFKVTRLNDTSWTEWSDPINMGKEINTTNSDWGYKISTDGKLAYFACLNNDNNNDIYTVELPVYLRPGFVVTISGKLVDKNNKPMESTIKWEDLETDKVVGESKSNPKDGSFFIVLPLGKVYGYFIDKDEYYPISNNIDLRTEKEPIEVENDIEMVTFKQMIDEGIAVPINNLFFPVNKDKLLPESIPELKRVAEIISANNLKVEISGHTDNVGTEEYNQELSDKRAKAVRDYLISIGVSKELITIIGFGATKPIADNETEEGKARNRRVELRFVQ
jgi:outer membrane protein OmpA-like peptidoglycan-associated protein